MQSGWFNSEVMLYMAFVAVANYTQPNFEMGYALKFMRLILLVLTAVLDLIGFLLGCLFILCFLIFKRGGGVSPRFIAANHPIPPPNSPVSFSCQLGDPA